MNRILTYLFSAVLTTLAAASERFELALVEPRDPTDSPKASSPILNEEYIVHVRFHLHENELDSAIVDFQKDLGSIDITSGEATHRFLPSVLIQFELTEENYDRMIAGAKQIVQPLIDKHGHEEICDRLDYFGQSLRASKIAIPKLHLVLVKSDLVLLTNEARLYCNNQTQGYGIDLISDQRATFPIQSLSSPQR